ncbi:MAG: polymer-forming cytoskeletal protein [Paludibacter sp.]
MAKVSNNNPGTLYNSLSGYSRISGSIVAENDFRIDGEIDGDITCKGKVVVGANGFLKGSVSCVSAEIIGKVEGNITASESISLRSTANIKSNVKTRMLIIEPNAIFNGTCAVSKAEKGNFSK